MVGCDVLINRQTRIIIETLTNANVVALKQLYSFAPKVAFFKLYLFNL